MHGKQLINPIKRRGGHELSDVHRRYNRVQARIRGPVERGAATIKQWQTLRGAPGGPSRLTRVTASIPTSIYQ